MSKVKIPIDDTDFKVEVNTETGKITVWNGRNGSNYTAHELAPFTDD